MLVGYIRVSTEEQNTARQEIALKELGVEKFFSEKMSGKNTERPELKKMMEFVREGDTVIVESVSRLARSTRDLLNIVKKLEDKKVEFVSIKEKFNTSIPSEKFIFTVFSALSELERENILQRQREGIEIAKLQGKYKGRKKIEIDNAFKSVYELWKKKDITAVQAMKQLDLKPNTFYRRVKEYEKSIS